MVPGHVKLTFTLALPRELAERLSARAIQEGKNLEAVVLDVLVAEHDQIRRGSRMAPHHPRLGARVPGDVAASIQGWPGHVEALEAILSRSMVPILRQMETSHLS